MNVAAMFGKFYGDIKHNVPPDDGSPPPGSLYANFTIGVYNFFKKEIEFFPCVAFGKTAAIIARVHQDHAWVSATGSWRHDKKEYKGKKYNDYKFQVFTVDVPHAVDAKRAEGQHTKPPAPEEHTRFDGKPPF